MSESGVAYHNRLLVAFERFIKAVHREDAIWPMVSFEALFLE